MKAPGAQIEANDEQPQPIEYEELFQECKVLFKNAMQSLTRFHTKIIQDDRIILNGKHHKLLGELQENLQCMIMEMQDKRQQQFKQEYSKLKEKYGGEFKLFEDMTKDQLAKEKREGQQ